MQNYMVNVVTSRHEDPTTDPIIDMNTIVLLQFGPCTKQEGEVLADRINAWVRGCEGGGPAKAFRNLGLNQGGGDVWASCDEIPSTGISELLSRFQIETTV